MALLPVFFLGGLSGAFFRPLAISYALAVLASMVVALTVTPALACILLRKRQLADRESPLVRWLQALLRARCSRRSSAGPRRPTWPSASSSLAGIVVAPAARASRCCPTSRSATS